MILKDHKRQQFYQDSDHEQNRPFSTTVTKYVKHVGMCGGGGGGGG